MKKVFVLFCVASNLKSKLIKFLQMALKLIKISSN